MIRFRRSPKRELAKNSANRIGGPLSRVRRYDLLENCFYRSYAVHEELLQLLVALDLQLPSTVDRFAVQLICLYLTLQNLATDVQVADLFSRVYLRSISLRGQ